MRYNNWQKNRKKFYKSGLVNFSCFDTFIDTSLQYTFLNGLYKPIYQRGINYYEK